MTTEAANRKMIMEQLMAKNGLLTERIVGEKNNKGKGQPIVTCHGKKFLFDGEFDNGSPNSEAFATAELVDDSIPRDDKLAIVYTVDTSWMKELDEDCFEIEDEDPSDDGAIIKEVYAPFEPKDLTISFQYNWHLESATAEQTAEQFGVSVEELNQIANDMRQDAIDLWSSLLTDMYEGDEVYREPYTYADYLEDNPPIGYYDD